MIDLYKEIDWQDELKENPDLQDYISQAAKKV